MPLLVGEYLVGKTLNEKMSIIHQFLESEEHKYLLVIDFNRCEDVIMHIKNGVYPVRVAISVDNNEEIIAYESFLQNAPTKSIYVHALVDDDARGIIEHCCPLIAIF